MDKSFTNESVFSFYPPKLQKLIYLNKKSQILKLLEDSIQFDGGIFNADTNFQESRHLIWLLRIDLLRKWGHYSEALAWVCLECELYPDNVTAIALKNQLKRELRLIPTDKKLSQVPNYSNVSWEGVAGMHELKMIFERDILLPLQEPEIYFKYKIPLPNGFLLYGPPGCGKTFIARKLAAQLKYNFIEVKPSDIASIYVHGTQSMISDLFNNARENAPTVMFFDEIEALVPNRSGNDLSHSYSSEVNEFLVQLNDCSKRKILVLGATNLPNKIDAAILRPGRLDKKIFVGPPDLEARAEALKLYLHERPQDNINILFLAEETEYYTYSELEQIVNDAARVALNKKMNIKTDEIFKIISEYKPLLNKEKIKEYQI
ncbi:MAG: ATP-binding protein [Bacteroidota bacterium]